MPPKTRLTNLSIQESILVFSQEAMLFFSRMSGMPPASETFIRNWCARRLHEKHGLIVTIETTRAQYEKWFLIKGNLDELQLKNEYRIDLVVYNPIGKDPSNAEPRAFVEFKFGERLKGVSSDIERISKFLTGAYDHSLEESVLFGYQVVCTLSHRKADLISIRQGLLSLTQGTEVTGNGSVHERSFPLEIIDEGKRVRYWCGVFGIEVFPQHRST